MIRLERVSKAYTLRDNSKHVVLDDVSVVFPAESRVGIIGMNGAGKSTLLRLLAGRESIDRGRIIRDGRVSFPLGFTGTFEPHETARENIRFLALIYEMDCEEVTTWIADFAELGRYFDMPVATYSSGMFARLAFATSFAFDFDVYLVDESIEVGDERFRRKCNAAFSQRLRSASLIMVSQNVHTIREYCDHAVVLHNGKLTTNLAIDEAIDIYESILRNFRVETR